MAFIIEVVRASSFAVMAEVAFMVAVIVGLPSGKGHSLVQGVIAADNLEDHLKPFTEVGALPSSAELFLNLKVLETATQQVRRQDHSSSHMDYNSS